MLRPTLYSFLMLICLLLPISGFALTQKVISLKDLISQADLIVIAEVVEQKTEQSQPEIPHQKEKRRPWIYTISTLQTTQCLKVNDSTCPSQVHVSQIGGSYQGITLDIPGQSLLKNKQTAIFFLKKKAQQERYVIVEFNRGVYPLKDLVDIQTQLKFIQK